MTITAALTAARARLAALQTSSPYSIEVALSLMRSDALAIFDELAASLVEEANQTAKRQLAEITRLEQERGIARTECLTAEMERDAALARRCPYLETVGGETWCNYPGEKEPDYVEMEGRCQS